MEPQDFSNALTKLLIETEEKLGRSVQRYQKQVADYVASLINSRANDLKLDLRKDGTIKPTAKNVKVLTRIKILVASFLDENILPGLRNFSSSFEEIASLNDEFFQAEFSAFRATEGIRKRVVEAARQRAVETMISVVKNDAVLNPITKILDAALSGGGSTRSQMISLFNDAIRGTPEKLGGLASFASRYVRDTLNTYARSYQEAQTANIDRGDRWYFYTSGLVDDSRPFCVERNGKYWHESEIKAWPRLNWQGKAAGTNERTIFTLVGGYNCMHQLILVSRTRVPASDLARING